MPQDIGNPITGLNFFNINTKMPEITDPADIQEALRLYHYGAPSGTGVGQYDPFNTDPTALKQGSVAYALYSLQTQITNVSGSLGVNASTWNAKGALVSSVGPSSVQVLNIPTPATSYEGFILTMNSGTTTGLSWASPSVTPTNTVTLTNKTLTAPRITASSFLADTNGNSLISFPALVTLPVNQITVSNAATGNKPTISATGTDTNITLNLVSKGTGFVQVNGVDIDTISGTQTLTNKTLTAPAINSPTVTQLYLSDSVIIFEGSVPDANETTLGVINPTVDRSINLPDVDGTVITTGNLSSITTVGTVTSGSFPAANLSGTSLPATITGSSLTSLGTVTSGTFPAANLSGTTLASNVVSSSLTSVGTLTSLNVTGNVVSHIAFNTTPTGTYTIVLSDDGKIVEIPAAGIVTIPSDATTNFPIGTQITILQTTSGQVTIAGATSPNAVTVNGTPGLKLRAQWSSCTLVKRATNLWVVMGDLAV